MHFRMLSTMFTFLLYIHLLASQWIVAIRNRFWTLSGLQAWPLGSLSSLGSFSTISVEEARVDIDWRTVLAYFFAVIRGRADVTCSNFELLHVLGNVTVSMMLLKLVGILLLLLHHDLLLLLLLLLLLFSLLVIIIIHDLLLLLLPLLLIIIMTIPSHTQ